MKALPLIGRILFSALFTSSGVNHFVEFRGYTEYARWMGVPMPELAVLVTGLMILVGGVLIVAGFQSKIGAALIFLFLIPTAFIMHPFWARTDPISFGNEMAHFMKNIALAGGAVMIFHFGTGPFSLERQKGGKRKR